VHSTTFVVVTPPDQGCQIFSWHNIPKQGKIYQMAIKYTKWPQNVPNGHKIFHCKCLQNLPKLGFLV
jgi:hypothetical protein